MINHKMCRSGGTEMDQDPVTGDTEGKEEYETETIDRNTSVPTNSNPDTTQPLPNTSNEQTEQYSKFI